jgi:putative ABC transport system permease protein
MFRNYLKLAWRNLMKNKSFSLINILGLTIGITVCMMIFLFITNEFSVDNFHKQRKNIYRVMRGFDNKTSKPRVPYLSAPYATALLNDYPAEIKKAVRVLPTNALICFGTTSFNEKKVYVADPDFFTLFSFPLTKGDASTALKNPGSVVLTQTTAKKYFGNADPIGKVIELDKSEPLKVTGVAKDIPANSHLNFDLVVSLTNYYNAEWFTVWPSNNLFTYVLLNNESDREKLEKGFPQFMTKYMGENMARTGSRFDLALTPLSDIYFEPSSSFDQVKHGDKTVVYIFLSIAVLILFIACINFTNLSTIRAIERSKEVGLRKVMGALRKHLVWQFIGESILLTSISCLLSIGFLQLLMPLYNQLLGYTLSISWTTLPIYLFLLSVIAIVGLLSGSYPAFVLSAFSPIQALKGKLRLGKGGAFFRQALVMVQFGISVLLIIGTIIIMKQMNYVKHKQLGYDKEQSIVVPLDNNDIYNNRNIFKNELQVNSSIAAVSVMSGEPGGFFDVHSYKAEGKADEVLRLRSEFADFEYVKTLGLMLIAGRDFSNQFATDTTDAVLINRTAAATIGYAPDAAIGKWIQNTVRDSLSRRIIGVVEDFNFLSLKEKMDALVITPGNDNRVAVIKIKPGNMQAAVAAIRETYNKVAPVYPFEYNFLDQKFDELYKTDRRQQTILSVFSCLAIFIACLGLFGLASFAAAKRVKEIGIRKVLGSSTQNIVLLLSKDLLKPVLIATLIAIPIGYLVMNNWLQNFAYRTPLYWYTFGLAALITFVIAVITVSLQAVKAAIANPVKSLRSE